MPELPKSLTLADKRVVLRDWRPDDAPALAPVCGDPDVCRFTSVPWRYTLEDAQRWVERVRDARGAGVVLALAITESQNAAPVGNVNLVRFSDDGHSAALGYWLVPSARGRGLATSAARLLCEWGFSKLDLTDVELAVLPENVASQRVAERLGAIPIGVRRDSHEADGQHWDMAIYSLTRGPMSPHHLDEPVRIHSYDPAWPARYEQERATLEEALGAWVVGGIHHVGSTAVPGLEAKPIIDILVGVEDLPSARACFEPLAGLGYLYAPYLADEMHWFCKPDLVARTHHLHLVPANSARFRDELAFRDHLRARPAVAAEYAALKRDLAGRFEHDRDGYTDAKSEFVRRVLAQAGS